MIALAIGFGTIGAVVVVAQLASPPVVDGNLVEVRSTRPAISIAKGDSAVRVWVGRYGDSLYVAADLPDTSYYWGDDLVVSLDPDGSGGEAPGNGDRQWYLRRDLDSSVVATASNGQWGFPTAIGRTHQGKDWNVAARSKPSGWTVELRIHAPLGRRRHIAFRTYDSAPHGWWSWPAPPESTRATSVERIPDLWRALLERSPQ